MTIERDGTPEVRAAKDLWRWAWARCMNLYPKGEGLARTTDCPTDGPAEHHFVAAFADARSEGERAGREAGRVEEREATDTIRSQRDEAESRLTLAFVECVKPVADAYITHGERFWSLRDGIERFLRERGRIE